MVEISEDFSNTDKIAGAADTALDLDVVFNNIDRFLYKVIAIVMF